MKDLGSFEILLILVLKLAELLLLAICWRANKIRSVSIVAGVFSLRTRGSLVESAFFCCLTRPQWAIGNLFWNSCNHVRGLFQLRVNRTAGPTGRELHFGKEVVLENDPHLGPGFPALVPWCSRNASAKCSYSWAQENFWFRQSTQIAGLFCAEFHGQLFSDCLQYTRKPLWCIPR